MHFAVFSGVAHYKYSQLKSSLLRVLFSRSCSRSASAASSQIWFPVCGSWSLGFFLGLLLLFVCSQLRSNEVSVVLTFSTSPILYVPSSPILFPVCFFSGVFVSINSNRNIEIEISAHLTNQALSVFDWLTARAAAHTLRYLVCRCLLFALAVAAFNLLVLTWLCWQLRSSVESDVLTTSAFPSKCAPSCPTLLPAAEFNYFWDTRACLWCAVCCFSPLIPSTVSVVFFLSVLNNKRAPSVPNLFAVYVEWHVIIWMNHSYFFLSMFEICYCRFQAFWGAGLFSRLFLMLLFLCIR